MKVSDFVATRLAAAGIEVCFSVTGGGAMHLNDSFGENKDIKCVYLHHEQAAAMAAEGYARIAGKPAVVTVTTGPGAINSFNGIFGAFTDSIPMIVIAGQVRSDTITESFKTSGLRQLGDQELRSIYMVEEITKFAVQIKSVTEVEVVLNRAIEIATEGRPGPVWVEIPVDIQALDIELNSRKNSANLNSINKNNYDIENIPRIAEMLIKAHRPLIMAGTGVRISGAEDELIRLAEVSRTPVVTAWTHDLIDSDHELFAGRPGTIGTRPGNFAVQNCDLLLVIGSRLNIRQISYNWSSFAPLAQIIWVDIDEVELNKPFIQPEIKLVSDAKYFLIQLLKEIKVFDDSNHEKWISWCFKNKEKYEPKYSDYVSTGEEINPYHLIPKIFSLAPEKSIFVCGNATACIVPFQVGKIRKGMRLFSNSGSASMGYDLPAAIGASIAEPSRKVICFAGDGSIMMNIQELETIVSNNLNITVFVLDNGGYLSIKQTQTNFFGHDHGSSPKSGITFPDFVRIGEAFGINSFRFNPSGDWNFQIQSVVDSDFPSLVVAPLSNNQEFEPRLKSKVVDGIIITPSLDDMYPHLSHSEINEIKQSALTIS